MKSSPRPILTFVSSFSCTMMKSSLCFQSGHKLKTLCNAFQMGSVSTRIQQTYIHITDMDLSELSLLSQPSHIRNWFPSYVSELQTSDEDCLSPIDNCESTNVTDLPPYTSKDFGDDTHLEEDKISSTSLETMRKEESAQRSNDGEIIALRNSVKYLETVVENLHHHIIRLVANNGKKKM
ncbi:PREDICTED: uncharacterized protein LOC104780941 isoform X2 [Camelina sativa]|uniref:Uncharacterized protein LOC104780941 isoform X2 n=1 Tax=Camelina sativa TaxID=90675 RepID=A0ABM0YNY0_CAMSA|nr:PREDICTED: uncharacterized protein LOC104780941 isoform X2 [Camelina sativa]